jgi:2-hydroxy-3-oxopropionate reductase
MAGYYLGCVLNILAFCEAFTLGKAESIDLLDLRKVILGGAANSWMLKNLGDKLINKDITAVQDLKLIYK